jgi:hypothetical protein
MVGKVMPWKLANVSEQGSFVLEILIILAEQPTGCCAYTTIHRP